MSSSGRSGGRFGKSSTPDVRPKSADAYTSHEDPQKAPTDYETEIKRKMLVEARLGLPDFQFKRHLGSESSETVRKVGLGDTNSVSAHDSVSQTGSTPLERNLVPYQAPDVTTRQAIHPVIDQIGHAIQRHNLPQRPPIPDIAHRNLPQRHPVPEPSTPNYGTSYTPNKVNPGKAYKRGGKPRQNAGLDVRPPGPMAAQPESAQNTQNNAPMSNWMQPGSIVREGLGNQPQLQRQNTALEVRPPWLMAARPQSAHNTQNNAPISNWMRPGKTCHDGQYNQPQFPVQMQYDNPEVHSIPTNNLPHPLQPLLWIPSETCFTTKFFTSAYLPAPFGLGTGGDWFKPQHTEIEIYGRIELAVFMGLIYQAHGIGAHLIVVALDIGIGPKTFHINLNSPLVEVDWVMIMGLVQLGCWSIGRITAIVHHRALFRLGN
ncbi:hypothetical protein Q9L58_006512 [Maublancomyces gigas]|uniref:Uncharacterized protein n=1 Tax=Discina gigas TaxID=1032678 RepID=A0ABR3GFI3_9PEZI